MRNNLQSENVSANGIDAFRGGSQEFWKAKIDDYPGETHGYFHHFAASLSQSTGEIVQSWPIGHLKFINCPFWSTVAG